jgi:hypothetical protein
MGRDRRTLLLSCHLRLCCLSFRIPTETVFEFIMPVLRASCPANPILLDLIVLMSGEEYKLLPVSPSFFGANILLIPYKQTPMIFPKCYRPIFLPIKVQVQLSQFSTALSLNVGKSFPNMICP